MEPAASHDMQGQDRVVRLIRILRQVDPRAIDTAVALVLAAAAIATVIGRVGANTMFREDDVLGTALVLAQTLPLAVRRVAPMGVLAVVSAAVAPTPRI